ncbi:SLOG family protein [Bengtsoniella intestinalis]|uniref:SLOG family protein n=1 Tax=Bengtsoniella intestinalis TaxID=3073143 RepID=UPI00391F820D
MCTLRGRETACAFTGHRPSKLSWGHDEQDPRCMGLKQRMADAIDIAYEQGFRHFICGMALGCDLYFCEAVMALRSRHDDVTIEAAIPCPQQSARWSTHDQARYTALVQACDFETVIAQHYSPGCMQRRDRYMVDHSALLIAAFDGSSGGTQYTMLYAMRQGLDVVDLPTVLV